MMEELFMKASVDVFFYLKGNLEIMERSHFPKA